MAGCVDSADCVDFPGMAFGYEVQSFAATYYNPSHDYFKAWASVAASMEPFAAGLEACEMA